MSEEWQSRKHPPYAYHAIAVISVVGVSFMALAAYHTSRRAEAEADKAGAPPVQVQSVVQQIQTPQQEPENDPFVEELRKLREKSDKR